MQWRRPLAAWRQLAIGDFNTYRSHLEEAKAVDPTAHISMRSTRSAFHDLWRHLYPDRREYSRFSRRNNRFRIDHGFLSQELAACAGTIHYSHEELFAGLFDYSPLILELAA
jgi:exonuclease III